MLVLSRKEGEGLVTSNGVRVIVTKVQGNRVTLGITAPPDVQVLREELMLPGYDPTNFDPRMFPPSNRKIIPNNTEIKT